MACSTYVYTSPLDPPAIGEVVNMSIHKASNVREVYPDDAQGHGLEIGCASPGSWWWTGTNLFIPCGGDCFNHLSFSCLDTAAMTWNSPAISPAEMECDLCGAL